MQPRNGVALLGIAALIAVDQLAKYLTRTASQPLTVAKLHFEATTNDQWLHLTVPPALSITATILILFALIIVAYRAHAPSLRRALALIIAGGLSNLIDRLGPQQAVIDIAAIANLQFNLADTYITLGTILALVSLVRSGQLADPVAEQTTAPTKEGK